MDVLSRSLYCVITFYHKCNNEKPIIFSRDAKFENFMRCFMARQDYFTCFEQSRTLCGPRQANSPMRAAKVQASLRIRAVSPEPPLLAHTSSESRGTFRQKARSLASLNGWACAVKTCHYGMLEDTNSLDGAHVGSNRIITNSISWLVIALPLNHFHI